MVADEITRPLREAAIRKAYASSGRADDLAELLEWGTPADAVAADKEPPKLAFLVTCPWCAGMWVGLGAVAARTVAPRSWSRLARALAASELAGKLA